jgi:archaellum component FlaC
MIRSRRHEIKAFVDGFQNEFNKYMDEIDGLEKKQKEIKERMLKA